MNKYGKLQFTLFKPQFKEQIEQNVMVLHISNSCKCIVWGQTTDTEIFVEFLMFLETFEDAVTSYLCLSEMAKIWQKILGKKGRTAQAKEC